MSTLLMQLTPAILILDVSLPGGWCQIRFWPSDPLCEEAPRSSILSQAQLESLWELLPPLLEPATPQLLYDNTVHGYSLQRMFARLQLAHGEIRNEPEIGAWVNTS